MLAVGFERDELWADNPLEADALPVDGLDTSLEAIVKLPFTSTTGKHLGLDYESVCT